MRRIFALALVLYLAVGCGIAETAEVEAAGSVNADGKTPNLGFTSTAA